MTIRQAAWPTFRRVIGGELPLSDEAAAAWLGSEQRDPGAIERLCAAFGGGDSRAARWLRYGRSALGLALDLCDAASGVLLAPYQCAAVFDKVESRCRAWRAYPLEADLGPEPPPLLEAGRAARAILTCVYFGSSAIERQLDELGSALLTLPGRPWVIEDRVMCFPEPGDASRWRARCDFALFSFRKHYPVPDGALLVACSDRARERLARCPASDDAGEGVGSDPAIRQKVLAKVKRHAWLAAPVIVDDPAWNGRRESLTSEGLVDRAASSPGADARAGTLASARWVLEHDLAHDARDTATRSRSVASGLRSALGSTVVPDLGDCRGVGVPLLVEHRDAFRARAAERGIFLPVHWPARDGAQTRPSVQRWYAREVTVPILGGGSADAAAFLVEALADVYRESEPDRASP